MEDPFQLPPGKVPSETTLIESHGITYDVPNAYVCPITLQIMDRPLLSKTGYNFEQSAILSWLEKNDTCPLTRAPLRPNQLIPNKKLRENIILWKDMNDYTFDGILHGDRPAASYAIDFDVHNSTADSCIFLVPLEESKALLERIEVQNRYLTSRSQRSLRRHFLQSRAHRLPEIANGERTNQANYDRSTDRQSRINFLQRVLGSALQDLDPET